MLFFFQAEDGIRDLIVTGVQTCALPIWPSQRFVQKSPEPRTALFEPAFLLDEASDVLDALPRAKIAENEGASAAHASRVPLHHFERGSDIRRKIDLVDDEQVRAGDAWAALRWDLVSGGDVDDIDGEVGELGR